VGSLFCPFDVIVSCAFCTHSLSQTAQSAVRREPWLSQTWGTLEKSHFLSLFHKDGVRPSGKGPR
jgi:hypothetical protein